MFSNKRDGVKPPPSAMCGGHVSVRLEDYRSPFAASYFVNTNVPIIDNFNKQVQTKLVNGIPSLPDIFMRLSDICV